MMSTCRRAAVAAMLLLFAACSSLEVTSPPGVDFSGTWHLDPASSDDWATARQTTMPPVRRKRDEPSPRAGKHGDPGDGTLRDALDFITPAADTLVIEQSARGLDIRFGENRRKRYRPGETGTLTVVFVDGKQKTGWEGNTFIVETKMENRVAITETLSLTRNRQQLIRRVTIDVPRRTHPLDVRQTYNRSQAPR